MNVCYCFIHTHMPLALKEVHIVTLKLSNEGDAEGTKLTYITLVHFIIYLLLFLSKSKCFTHYFSPY